jgi:hypothetical protein
VRDGLSSAFNWEMKKRRRFVNTIAPWPMLVRQSLRNLQRCGAFIPAFTSKKMKDDGQKKFIPQLTIDTAYFYRTFGKKVPNSQSLYEMAL